MIVRAGREIVRIETYAGPLSNDPDGGKDLGAVPAREAAAYLLGLAATLEGRPARDAMQPAMLADSAVRDTAAHPTRPGSGARARRAQQRDLLAGATSWRTRRRRRGRGAAHARRHRPRSQRERIHPPQCAEHGWQLRTRRRHSRCSSPLPATPIRGSRGQALSSLANSGDPRARQFVRDALRRTDLPEESRAP